MEEILENLVVGISSLEVAMFQLAPDTSSGQGVNGTTSNARVHNQIHSNGRNRVPFILMIYTVKKVHF